MPSIIPIALSVVAITCASAAILISGARAYEDTSIPLAASGLAMIYEEAVYDYNLSEETPLPQTDHQTIARALEVFEDFTKNYLDSAKNRLKRKEVYLIVTREEPEENAQFGPIISLDDPWGTPFQFTVNPDKTLTAISAGADQTFNTADDVTSAAAREIQNLPHPSSPDRKSQREETN